MEDRARSNSKEPASSSRYERLVKIASGGMASVYVGRLRGALGFQQLVAIKRPHTHLLNGTDLKAALLAEARVASRIRHANVVGVRDVETEDDSLLLVMDYVEGASLHELLYRDRTADRGTAIRAGLRVIRDLCAGLQAVHDLTDDDDRPLGLVHRDVSPQNVLVGIDGVARLADFGIAKCLHAHDTSTAEGTLKGKFAYMAPEYILGHGFDQRLDIFAVGVLLWEILANRKLFEGESHIDIIRKVLGDRVPLISEQVPEVGDAFDAVVDCALARDPASRFAHARDLSAALDVAIAQSYFSATHEEVAVFVREQAGPRLAERKRRVKEGMGASQSSSSPAVRAVTTAVVDRVDAPSPPEAVNTAISAPEDSRIVRARPSRRVAIIAIASFGLVLLLGLGALAGSGALSSRAKQVSPDEPSAGQIEQAPAGPSSASSPSVSAPPRSDGPSPTPTVSHASSAGVSPSVVSPNGDSPNGNEPAAKPAPDRFDKPSKPKKAPTPSNASAPAAPGASEVPRPRGNPY